MNNPDHNSDVCTKDSYGNVTAKNQNGNETKYKDYTIVAGILVAVWKSDDSYFGKFSDVASAKAAIDAAIQST